MLEKYSPVCVIFCILAMIELDLCCHKLMYVCGVALNVGTGMFLKTCYVTSPWREQRSSSV